METISDDCIACGGDEELEEKCEESPRPCMHHCNHWSDGSECHFCGAPEAGEEICDCFGYGECKGELIWGPCPFNQDVNGDHTPVWLCEYHHQQRADDI